MILDQTIRELRKPEITFPKNFDTQKYAEQTFVIRWLLNHDPKQRPTSLQLLQSRYIPPKLEDEYIKDALRAIVNNNTPYYSKLLTALFLQVPDKLQDYTYEFNSVRLLFFHYIYLNWKELRKGKQETSRQYLINHKTLEQQSYLLITKKY